MLISLKFPVLLALFLASIWGYGWVSLRVARVERDAGIGYAAAVGIMVLSVLGGLLNDIGQAYRGGVDAIYGLGVLLFAVALGFEFFSVEGRLGVARGLRHASKTPAAWFALVVLVLSSTFLVPSSVLNPHDDLTQYLLRPMLMMQTGTLGGNWFDNTGVDGLGMQSWLQAFFLAHLPLTYADAVDDVVCLPLCILLLGDLGRLVGAGRLQIFATALVLTCINPVQVNTSAKYSIVLMLLASITATTLFARQYIAERRRVAVWIFHLGIAAGCSATAVALKSTALGFASVAVSVLALGTLWLCSGIRDRILAVLSVIGTCLATAIIFCLPFLVQYRAMKVSTKEVPTSLRELIDFRSLLTTDTLPWSQHQYGQRPLNTTIGFFIVLFFACVAFVIFLFVKRDRLRTPPALTVAVFGIAGVLSYMIAIATTTWGFLRYVAPMLTAILPAALLIAPMAIVLPARRPSSVRVRVRDTVAVSICAAMVALNLTSIDERLGLAWNQHTASILGHSEGLPVYVDQALSEKRARRVAAIQNTIPMGSTILAAILTPTDVDFRRNPGYDVYVAGMGSPWIADMGGESANDISRWLETLGIKYLLWQGEGDYLLTRKQLLDATEDRVPFNARTARSFLALFDAANTGALGPTVSIIGNYVVLKIDPSFKPMPGPPYYVMGDSIDFTSDGINRYSNAGWSSPEPTGTWTDGAEANLNMRLTPPPQEDLVLKATYTPLVVAGQAMPTVNVEANGTDITRWTPEAAAVTRCATIPARLVADGTLKLRLKIDKPISLAELHISPETRHLGILVRSLSVDLASKAGTECAG